MSTSIQDQIETLVRMQNLHIAQQISKQFESRGFKDPQLSSKIIKFCQQSQSPEDFVSKATQETGSSISQHFLSSLYNTIRQKLVDKVSIRKKLENMDKQNQLIEEESPESSLSGEGQLPAKRFPERSGDDRADHAKERTFPGLCLPNNDEIDLDLDLDQKDENIEKIEQVPPVHVQRHKRQRQQELDRKPKRYDDYEQRRESNQKKKKKEHKRRRSYSDSRSRSRDKRKKNQRRHSSDSDRSHRRRKEKKNKSDNKYRDRSRERGRERERERQRSWERSHRQRRERSPEKEKEVEKGGIYRGIITRVEKTGCFVKLLNVKQFTTGLVHKSQIRQAEVNDPHEVIRQNQRVFVRIVQILQDRIRLSMKEVNQRNGESLVKPDEKSQHLVMEQEKEGRRQHQRHNGQLTGIKIDEKEEASKNNEIEASSYAQLWELNRLKYMGGIVKGNPIIKEDIEEVTIEMNDREPPFLTGQTTKAGINLSPVRVVKNPEGTLQREAMNALQYAKDRREIREQQKKQEPRDLTSVLDEVTPATTTRDRIKSSLSSQPKSSKMTLIQQKTSLPIYHYRNLLVQACRDNNVLIVIGETGSGKTTQITQYLHQQGFSKRGKIGCTQPRRVAAMSVAKRVGEEMNVKLGEEVGYAIRFEDCTSRRTIIKYMTDGMLLREALIDKYLSQYSVIMLDEAHERTIHTDVLFGILKKVTQKRTDFNLIVTSATLQAKKFSSYFFNCKIFSIPGRTYDVEILYSKEPETDYLDAALMCVLQIHMDQPPGDILMFLTGQEEIDTACQILTERLKKMGADIPELIILPVYSALPSQMQTRIFDPAPKGKRKCVIATNIAEASLTIDGIFYVVDPGFAKIKIYNSKLGMDTLVVAPISQASAKQRAGRAGRTGPGKCYRIYTEEAYQKEMLPTSVPEIQRANLANTVLELKAMGINDLINFDFMDPPPIQTLIAALEQLYYLSALDDEGLLTKLGRKMAEFPLQPSLSKMLLTSVDLDCSQQIVTIISMLSVQNVFYRPKEKETIADQKKTKFNHHEGDHLTYLSVFESWKSQGYSSQWCHENYIQYRSLKRALDVKKQIEDLLRRYKFRMTSCNGDFGIIRKTIVSGFFFHAAKKDPKGGYRTLVDDHQVYIHPSSSLFNKEPEWVVYHELIFTSKEYMRDVCAIQPKWLTDVAPNFFKETDDIGFTRKKRNQKLDPLNQKHGDNNAWRLSKRKG